VPLSDHLSLADRLRERLLKEASTEGGWAYYPGKSSRIEPTCWTLLALAETWPGDETARQAFLNLHLRFLAGCQRADGLLAEVRPSAINFTANGLAGCALTFLSSDPGSPVVRRVLEGLVSVKGVRTAQDPTSTQDNSLQGWPWNPDTFSWVEPTSWCLLALKKAGSGSRSAAAAARIAEAERLLANRTCKAGGWNYGNATVFGQDLRPYVPTTVLGLLALQTRRTDPAVTAALAFLESARAKEDSGMALALTAVVLRVYGRPTGPIEERLAAVIARAEQRGNLQTLAMALYALSGAQHDVKAFRV
jgi:hypothetical protein